jgi:hypothetical protein
MTYGAPSKSFLIGKESTFGTPVTADKDVGLVQDINDDYAKEIIESMSIGSIEAQAVNDGSFTLSQNATIEVQNGRMFEFVVGEASHAETTGDWKHTFTVDNEPKGFTSASGENGTTDTNLTMAGNLIENAELSIELNGNLSLSFTHKGFTTASSASAADQTIDTLIVFPHKLVSISVAGSSADEVQNFSVTFEKKVEQSFGIGSQVPQQSKATELHMRFSGTLGFTDVTYQELFLGGTTPQSASGVAIILDADNGTSLGSGQRQVKCTLSDCQFSKFTKTCSVGNLIFVELEGTGILSELFTVDDISSSSWF